MKRILSNFSSLWCLLLILALPGIAGATTFFVSTDNGDVDLGLRKTGVAAEQYETVVNLCNINDLLSMTLGTTTNFNNFTHSNFTNMCPDGITNLQWSVFSTFFVGTGSVLPTAAGVFTNKTCWYTFPRTNPAIQSIPIQRISSGSAGGIPLTILSICDDANSVSTSLGSTNANNYAVIVEEPVSLAASGDELSALIADASGVGDFGGGVISYSVENHVSNTAAATISDFYQNVPAGTKYPDPATGRTNGACFSLGFFTMSTAGSLSFTRASEALTALATSGSAPLSVTFTNAGAVGTNWVWSFGDGSTLVTNTTGASVAHTYANNGSYTVTLKVTLNGVTTTYTFSNYVVVSSTPSALKISAGMFNSKFVISATNWPVGNAYAIIATTNLFKPTNQWVTVASGTVPGSGNFFYTNSNPGTNYFYRVVP